MLGNARGGDAQHVETYFPPTHTHKRAWTRFLCLPVLESYLPSTAFEKRKTFLCAICISICWHWRHGKWIIGLMGNVGERGIEKDREKAAWKKNAAITGRFFPSPPPLVISPSTSQPLVLLKRFTLASHFHSFCTTPSPSLSLVCTRTLWLFLIHIHPASPLLPLSPTAWR